MRQLLCELVRTADASWLTISVRRNGPGGAVAVDENMIGGIVNAVHPRCHQQTDQRLQEAWQALQHSMTRRVSPLDNNSLSCDPTCLQIRGQCGTHLLPLADWPGTQGSLSSVAAQHVACVCSCRCAASMSRPDLKSSQIRAAVGPLEKVPCQIISNIQAEGFTKRKQYPVSLTQEDYATSRMAASPGRPPQFCIRLCPACCHLLAGAALMAACTACSTSSVIKSGT